MSLTERPSKGNPGLMCFQVKDAMLGHEWRGSYDYWLSLADALGMTLDQFCKHIDKVEQRLQ
jgi:pyrroloquinoline quinone (PQQ) biosynthesis protein C